MSSQVVARLLGRAMKELHPVSASMELTYACNLHCLFCFNPVVRKGQERTTPAPAPGAPLLSYEEIVGVLEQLQEMGILYLTLTGGEPLLHPRFWDVAYEAKRRAFAIRLFSNGTTIDEGVADRLVDLAPNCVEISVHGATSGTAEALNQVAGSHERLLAALGLLKERGIRVFLKAVVTRLTAPEVPGIQALADGFGFPLYLDMVVTPSDDGDLFPLDLRATDDQFRDVLRNRTRYTIGSSPFEQPISGLSCGLAMGTLHVDPYGNVQPCIQWKESGGNVRRQSIQEIWTASQVFEEARAANRKIAELRAAGDDALCGHCPALSKLRHGDVTRPEEQRLRLIRLTKELEAERAGLRLEPTTEVTT